MKTLFLIDRTRLNTYLLTYLHKLIIGFTNSVFTPILVIWLKKFPIRHLKLDSPKGKLFDFTKFWKVVETVHETNAIKIYHSET